MQPRASQGFLLAISRKIEQLHLREPLVRINPKPRPLLMKIPPIFPRVWLLIPAVLYLVNMPPPATGDLYDNLQAFSARLDVGDPEIIAEGLNEGPKGIVTADFDRDGFPDLAVSNLDGSVTYYRGGDDGQFAEPDHLQTGARSLRQLIAADLNQDRLIDLAVAAPFDGIVFLLFNDGLGSFGEAQELSAWIGARNLEAGDFDGDGVTDLAVAGPQKGLRHYRGLGDGTFTIAGDLPMLDPVRPSFPKPVYTLKAVASGDDGRDDLVVTHANSTRTWILSSQPAINEADRVLDGSDGVQQFNPIGVDPDFPLLISEFCASNDSIVTDEDGEFSDWIEVLNRSQESVSLNGWGLSDSITGPARWVFPERTLEPGRFLIVFASGKDRRPQEGNLHCNFKLSSKGEVLTLHRPNNAGSQSFPPPGAPRARLTTTSPLRITDFGFAATEPLVDDQGNAWDWIRIENRQAVTLPTGSWGIRVSDQITWRPETPSELRPGESKIVMFSGRNTTDALGHLHTPFAISLLNNVVSVIDSLGLVYHQLDWSDVGFEFPEQVGDISFGMNLSGHFNYFDLPTPGWTNNAGVETLNELPIESGANVTFATHELGDFVRVEVIREDSLLHYQYLWFCFDSPTGIERHVVMKLETTPAVQSDVPRYYTAPLPEGYTEGMGYRIMAAAIDLSDQNKEITLELASGGAFSRVDVPVQTGGLRVATVIPGQAARALDVGALLFPASEGVLDLVSANRDSGNLEIRRGTARSSKFEHQPSQVVRVPGGPRSVKIVDLDRDGWNDLVVALRNFDRIVVFKNEEGTLKLASEVPTGVSPREIAVADFNGDGQPDTAAINRVSSDVSIVPTFPGTPSLSTLDQVYETDGEVVDLKVIDVTGDGKDDVVQLHRASGDISIREADPNGSGRLSAPEFIHIGTSPSAAELIDVDGDSRLDIVTANLDSLGSVSVRRGTANGFAPEERYALPESEGGGLFALRAADFDGDGIADLAAGYFDCRLALFRGTETGTFEYVRTTRFTYESRVMTTGDFDGDGDIDLAGAGYAGDVVVFENRGNLLTDTSAPRWDYSPRSSGKYGTREISAVDFNGDGDLDLMIGSGKGVLIYRGTTGMLFAPNVTALQGTEFPTAGTATGDFNGDSIDDIAVSCRLLSCVSIQSGDGTGKFLPTLSVDVPAGGFLAAGDLDGDGRSDLVGAGDVLWTALSSRRSMPVPATNETSTRVSTPGVVINEILAVNTAIPVDSDNGKKSDWLELYNNSNNSVSIGGWELEVETSDSDFEEGTYSVRLPTNATLSPGEHRLVFFSPDIRSDYHTGIRLPGSGATLSLLSSSGETIDNLTYSDQQQNVAYGRYEDGSPAFIFNPIPSPGTANSFDGSPDPDIRFDGFDFSNLQPGQPIQFHVKAKDDLGLLGVSVVYQRLDVPGSPPEQFLLFDDGEHGDGEMLDGWFSGSLRPGLPPSGEFQFYFVAEDLSGNIIESPDETVFVSAGETIRTFSVGFSGINGPPPLTITEVSADNETGLTDEAGGAADYVIVRNNGMSAVSLDGVSLAKQFDANDEELYRFPAGGEIAPGDTFVVFADGNTKQGSRHAPFKIDRGGEELFLLGRGALGSRVLIDHVTTPRVETDRILTKIGDTDLWASTLPEESRPESEDNQIWQGQAFSPTGEPLLAVAFKTEEGVDYLVEFMSDGNDWEEFSRVTGDGSLSLATQSYALYPTGSFRVTEFRPPVSLPEFRNISAITGKTDAEISGLLSSDGGEAPVIHIYSGLEDAGDSEVNWQYAGTSTSDGLEFRAEIPNLESGQNYVARVKATNSAGTIWSSPVTFITRPASAPELNDILITQREVDGFRIDGKFALADRLTVFYGTKDGMETPGEWAAELDPALDDSNGFSAQISGLEAGTDYFVRVRAENDSSTVWTSSALRAQTLTEVENLRTNLLISEIMYHPRRNGNFLESDFEYIEFYNSSRSPILLEGLRFIGGIEFDFSSLEQPTLQPKSYAVIVANRQGFNSRYAALEANILGEWITPFQQTKLSNKGETLTLQSAATGEVIHSITYDDRFPWPGDPDGGGQSLTLGSVEPGQDLSIPDSWIASVSEIGTPGFPAVTSPLIVSRPLSITIEEGGSHTFAISVIGKPPMIASWTRDGSLIGAESEVANGVAILEFQDVKMGDTGNITLEVTNEFGSAKTDTVALTVIPRSSDPGNLDIGFSTGSTVHASDLLSLPGGGILAVGFVPTATGGVSVARLKENGVVDPGFHTPNFRGGAASVAALLDDGRIVIAGAFKSVDGIPRNGIVVLTSLGQVDTTFNPDFVMAGAPRSIMPQRDGSIIIGGSLTAVSADTVYTNLFRILPNGRLDSSFTQNLQTLVSMTDSWRYQDEGQTYGSEWRLADFDDSKWKEGQALLYVEQAPIDGPTNTEITLTRGATTYYFRRNMWNPFEQEVVVDLQVSYFADDGIVAYINGEEILRRRLPEGVVTPTTRAAPKIINAKEEGPFIIPRVRLQPGHNVVTAEVHQEAPTSSDVVFGMQLMTPARVGSASSLQKGADGIIHVVAPAKNERMFVGGQFSSITGTVRRSIARLHADGTVDTSFESTQRFTEVSAIVSQPDGKIIVGGTLERKTILTRLMPDGSIDPSFNSPTLAAPISAIALSNDGTFYVALNKLGSNILHFLENGTINPQFQADSINGWVGHLLPNTDGSGLTIAGSFNSIDTVARQGLARLFSELGDSAVRLQTSRNLIEWTPDRNAVIDLSSSTVHASPELGTESMLFFRVDGMERITLQPGNPWKNRLFLELRDQGSKAP